jgi:hypothetical protein
MEQVKLENHFLDVTVKNTEGLFTFSCFGESSEGEAVLFFNKLQSACCSAFFEELTREFLKSHLESLKK